jgi:NAD-dependent dihydropyrimidine dehydrogenase PreA subunit
MLSHSNYVASVDEGTCIACGVCEDRCPVGAITVQEDLAGVDASRCLGCGACTPTCDVEAVRLVLREEVKPPPQPMEFLEARLK